MPRTYIESEPRIVNKIQGNSTKTDTLYIATTNQDKLREFQRLIPHKRIEGIKLDIDEAQSLDHYEVVSKKAKIAFEKYNYNPILVEDTSFEIAGLNNRPGPFADFFISDPEMRKEIATRWLKDKDRRASVKVKLAMYDGVEVHVFEGITDGEIAFEPKGNSFGFDDIFIPDNQTGKHRLTFAQMTPQMKDKYSMRRKAIEEYLKREKELKLGRYILEIPEPFASELLRLRPENINKRAAVKFAYTLEAIVGNKPNANFYAPKYLPVIEDKTIYYERLMLDNKSASIGIVITDIDKAELKLKKNGDYTLWQMGPERRQLALAQRAEYFLENTDPKLIKLIQDMEKTKSYPKKVTKRSATLETLLRIDYKDTPFYARAIREVGYKKLAASKEVSRRHSIKYGLINKIGKYPRLMLGIGSMPACSCHRDVILTGIMGHMPVFIARNNIYAGNTPLRIKLIKQVLKALDDQELKSDVKKLFQRNIGVAIGSANPRAELEIVKKIYNETGVSLFRIYGINSDPRVIETAELLRKTFGNKLEIFAGQLVDKEQGVALIERAGVDGLVFGHGGGRQCTSATNGMALSSLEEIYSVVTDERFSSTTLLHEGGIGKAVGGLMVLGIDGILYNQQLTRGTLETGGIFLQNKKGEWGQPYNGSASAATMVIEAANQALTDKMLNYSGRTKVTEGKKGFTLYAEKANSMAFWIEEFKHQMARTLADLGVNNMNELRDFVASYDKELLRIVTPEAQQLSQAWGAGK
ncbi:MAG: Euphorbia ringspot virus [Candidatus Parcubacteria bacterium]